MRSPDALCEPLRGAHLRHLACALLGLWGMTTEMRRATWRGLDGRLPGRAEQKPEQKREASPPAPGPTDEADLGEQPHAGDPAQPAADKPR